MARTPLYEIHVAAGARMVDFAGWEMPVQYTSILDEHAAVRSRAGIFDVSHMGEVEISGQGAELCCARLFANDARRLAPGKAQYSLIANEDGGLVDDVIVYRLEAERFMVCLNASNTPKDLAWISERAPGGCSIDDRSKATALIAVQGPAAAAIVAAVAPATEGLARFGCAHVTTDCGVALAARTGYTGEDGFELFVDAARAAELWELVAAAGAAHGAVPVGLGARDTLRLEAALPLYGHEIDDTTSPYEAGLDWVVKLDRPDMIGYQALGRRREDAKRRRLVGLEIDGGIARQGCAVMASGETIGVVTSGSHCPTLGRAVALARLDREPEGAVLAVEVRGKLRSARVTGLPFYVRAKRTG